MFLVNPKKKGLLFNKYLIKQLVFYEINIKDI